MIAPFVRAVHLSVLYPFADVHVFFIVTSPMKFGGTRLTCTATYFCSPGVVERGFAGSVGRLSLRTGTVAGDKTVSV